MPNKEKLIDLAVWIGGQQALNDLGLPSEWEQGTWFSSRGIEVNGDAKFGCGTACCAAGRTALINGGTPVFTVSTHNDYLAKRWEEMNETERRAATSGHGYAAAENGDGVYVDVSETLMAFPQKDGSIKVLEVEEFAREELGLNSDQAYLLFSGSNDYDQMIHVIRELLAEDAAEGAPEEEK